MSASYKSSPTTHTARDSCSLPWTRTQAKLPRYAATCTARNYWRHSRTGTKSATCTRVPPRRKPRQHASSVSTGPHDDSDWEQWQWGAGKTSPHAYIISKNKMADRTDSERKQRVIFSYAEHPLKAYSRLMGEGLVIMVEQGHAHSKHWK